MAKEHLAARTDRVHVEWATAAHFLARVRQWSQQPSPTDHRDADNVRVAAGYAIRQAVTLLDPITVRVLSLYRRTITAPPR